MKIETINTWGGQITEPLLKHLEFERNSVDIFCFQEIFNGNPPSGYTFPNAVVDIYTLIDTALPDHKGHFRPSQNMGLASFVHQDIKLGKEGDIFVFRWQNAMDNENPATQGRNLQYLQFEHNGQQYTVANLHGLWNGQGKTDTGDRISQSNKAKEFLDSQEGAKILVGDFNLLPGTKSLSILEAGMRNLVTEYGVTSTRSSYYTKPEKYADYILVSPEVDVLDFKVVPEEVSDHLALQLTFK